MPTPLSSTDAPAPPSHQQGLLAVRALARAARMLERSSGKLTLAQYRVLTAIAEGDERASRVARRLALGKPTVSALVEALLQRGLIERTTFLGDQRVAALALTSTGVTVLARVEEEMLATLASITEQMAGGEALVAHLAEMAGAIDALFIARERPS